MVRVWREQVHVQAVYGRTVGAVNQPSANRFSSLALARSNSGAMLGPLDELSLPYLFIPLCAPFPLLWYLSSFPALRSIHPSPLPFLPPLSSLHLRSRISALDLTFTFVYMLLCALQ